MPGSSMPEHKGKPFFDELVEYMVSGPIVVAIVEKENAIKDYRAFIGNTDPKKAAPNTIRALYGKDISENAIHASDSPESSARECNFHFAAREIYDDARQGAFERIWIAPFAGRYMDGAFLRPRPFFKQ